MAIIELLGLPPRAVALAASGLLVVAVLCTSWFVAQQWFPAAPPERAAMAYFYDQNTGQLFAAPATLLGPLVTPSGPFQGAPAGVRARVFSCGQCWDPAARQIAWLEAPAAALLAAGVQLPPPPNGPEGTCDVVIRRPTDARWVYLTSREGLKIIDEVQTICSGTSSLCFCEPSEKLLCELTPEHRQVVEAERQRALEQERTVERERPLELKKEKELERQAAGYDGPLEDQPSSSAPPTYRSK